MNQHLGHIPYPTLCLVWYMDHKPFKCHLVLKVGSCHSSDALYLVAVGYGFLSASTQMNDDQNVGANLEDMDRCV